MKLYAFLFHSPHNTACRVLVIIALLATFSAQAESQSIESLNAAVITFVAAQYVETAYEVTSTKLDDRLRLAECKQPLNAAWSKGQRSSGNTVIEIRCDHPKTAWRVYVPVKIKLFKHIATARRSLKRSEVLQASDIVMEKQDVSGLQDDYIEHIEPFIGYITTRPIGMRQPVTTLSLKPPALIKRGENVTLVAKSATIEIRISGEALTEGAMGDIIRIRNHASQKVVEGQVIAKGVAQTYY